LYFTSSEHGWCRNLGIFLNDPLSKGNNLSWNVWCPKYDPYFLDKRKNIIHLHNMVLLGLWDSNSNGNNLVQCRLLKWIYPRWSSFLESPFYVDNLAFLRPKCFYENCFFGYLKWRLGATFSQLITKIKKLEQSFKNILKLNGRCKQNHTFLICISNQLRQSFIFPE